MVQFSANKPHRSKVPEVVVENPLEPGRHLFSLVVVDDSGNESEPFQLVVSVVQRTRPDVRPDLVRDFTILRRPTPEPSPLVVDRLRRPIRPLRPR